MGGSMKRESRIDVAKGIGCLLVLLGHSLYINKHLKNWIFSFHMPLFFFISGYLFNYDKYKDDYKTFLKKRVKSLIIPYFLLQFVIWILLFMFQYHFCLTTEALNRFIGIFLGYRMHKWYFYLWFLILLFFIENILYFLIKYFNKFLYIIAVISYIAGYYLIKYVHGFYLNTDLIPLTLSFVIAGYLYKRDFSKMVDKLNNVIKIIMMMILLSISIFVSYKNSLYYGLINMHDCNLGFIHWYIVAAFSGVAFTFLLSSFINKNKILEDLGKNTITIWAFQNPIVFPIAYFLLDNLSINRDIKFVLSIIITLPILRLLAYLTDKYVPIMSGKSKRKEL